MFGSYPDPPRGRCRSKRATRQNIRHFASGRPFCWTQAFRDSQVERFSARTACASVFPAIATGSSARAPALTGALLAAIPPAFLPLRPKAAPETMEA
jgi:hypothetical protein